MATQFDAVTKARTALIHKHVFFGVLALQLQLVEDKTIETMGVNGKTVWWNPDFVNGLPKKHLQGVLGHEIMHCVLDHMGRVGSRNLRLWNVAADYAINPLLKECGFELPEPHLDDARFHGKTADEIYTILMNENCDSKNALDEIRPGGADEASTEQLRGQWKIAVAQAALLAQQQGQLPGALKRFVDELLEPQIDWRAQLRRCLLQTQRHDDFTWAKFNRRHLHSGMYLPGMDGHAAGKIATVIDTSGSITDTMLQIFGSEIKGIKEEVNPEKLIVTYCDADIAHVDEFGEYDEPEFTMYGGGGTDFRPPFAAIEASGEYPSALVYLTDGYGPFPKEAPDYPVIWCMTTEVTPPWGEVVRVKA